MANDQERAAFEAWSTDNGEYPLAVERDSAGNYRLLKVHTDWIAWQAARAAPAAAPVQAVPEAWRKLALQFDGQRMQALAHLRAMLQGPAAHADVAKAFLAAAPAAPQVPAVPEWRPIETAPKDGAAILVFAGGFCYSVEWSEEFSWWRPSMTTRTARTGCAALAPTHWMPLPASPSAATQPAEPCQTEPSQLAYDIWCAACAGPGDDIESRVARIDELLRAAQQPAERVPLTDEQIYEALDADVDEIAAAGADTESWGVIVTMVRAIEQAHGIRAAGVKEPPNAGHQGREASPA